MHGASVLLSRLQTAPCWFVRCQKGGAFSTGGLGGLSLPRRVVHSTFALLGESEAALPGSRSRVWLDHWWAAQTPADRPACASPCCSTSPLPPRNQVVTSEPDVRASLPPAAHLSWRCLLDFFQNSGSVVNQILW